VKDRRTGETRNAVYEDGRTRITRFKVILLHQAASETDIV